MKYTVFPFLLTKSGKSTTGAEQVRDGGFL